VAAGDGRGVQHQAVASGSADPKCAAMRPICLTRVGVLVVKNIQLSSSFQASQSASHAPTTHVAVAEVPGVRQCVSL
jgi:hypothetical protein